MLFFSAVLALPAKVLGPSDISPTNSDQTGERKHAQNGAGNETDSGKTSQLPYYNVCVGVYIDIFIYIYNEIQTGKS